MYSQTFESFQARINSIVVDEIYKKKAAIAEAAMKWWVLGAGRVPRLFNGYLAGTCPFWYQRTWSSSIDNIPKFA